jgi:hypothetical protein
MAAGATKIFIYMSIHIAFQILFSFCSSIKMDVLLKKPDEFLEQERNRSWFALLLI